MTVFKNYFKIVKKHLGIIIMFSAISIGISIVNTSYSTTDEYVNVESSVAIINKDNSALVDNFIEYIDTKATIKQVEDNPTSIQDALYDNKVDAILIIPSDFTEYLLTGKTPKIEIKKSAKNLSTTIELITNKYFQIADIYSHIGIEENELITKINNDLSKNIQVKMSNKSKTDSIIKLTIYYSFENYAFLSIFIFIIGTIMCIFNKDAITKRNAISKMKPNEISRQLFLGHLCLTLSIWFIFALISIIIYKDLMLSITGLLFILNSLIFAITCTSLAFLLGSLIKNQNVISGIQNVFSLGLSFISGCFVGPELLNENILNFSKIFPSYWFINNNYEISKLTNYNLESLKPIYQNFIIVFLFGVLFLIISKIITKRKIRK